MITFSRTLPAVWMLVFPVWAAPPLTTIQDVLYKADGTRFNGLVNIAWSSFEAPDHSAIATQLTTVKVVDGNLRVQLVPNSQSDPQVYYAVTYSSDGRVQFRESWAVPASAQALRIRDVRVSAANVVTEPTPIPESDVVGLIADLAARPVKGTSFASGRVAMINPLGALDAVTGSANDCVRVDGSAAPCGSAEGAPAFVDGDIPAGIVDGANTSFSLSATPSPAASLAVYRNGLLLAAGADYTLSSRTIHFVPAATPQPADSLLASYRLSGAAAGSQLFSAPQVLCAGTGAATGSATFSSLGNCSLAANTLAAGDRVEIRFDLEHQGAASGFTFEVRWGATTLLHRDANAADVLATGRVDAGLFPAGAQVSTQSWGTVLPFIGTVASASDAYTGNLVIDFQGKMDIAGETLALRNFTVVRLP